jgi:hypothetical protein
MEGTRFDRWVRVVGARPTRRAVIAASLAALKSLSTRPAAEGKERCKKSGKPCKSRKKGCKARYCETGLEAPFTIEAAWTNPQSDHDAFLFVPNAPGNVDPRPFIDMDCTPDIVANGDAYPFAFGSRDAYVGPGSETITVKTLIDGVYEYHLQLDSQTPANDATVRLIKNGKVLHSWSNPASPQEDHWRVFSLTAQKGRAVLQPIGDVIPQPQPITRLCRQ